MSVGEAVPGLRVRPLRADDIVEAERVSGKAFATGYPAEFPRPPERAQRWRQRAQHLLAHDPGGCWVAEVDDAVVGVATSLRRDLLWGLSMYAVVPVRQGQGVGRVLLDAALGYSRGCLRGILCAAPDPLAYRRYRSAGFTLHPTVKAVGVVDRSTLPVVDAVRDGGAGDRDLCDSVDRRVRGAVRGPDHDFLARGGRLLVCDTFTGQGYAYLRQDGVSTLAATNRAVAQRLLWEALARVPPGTEVTVGDLTVEQDWAVDIGLAARLSVLPDGYLGLRHMRPPMPYVPSAVLL